MASHHFTCTHQLVFPPLLFSSLQWLQLYLFEIDCLIKLSSSAARIISKSKGFLDPNLSESLKNQDKMSHYFPEEILIEILIKLPVKTLIRFTLVSKSWHTLIRSSNFVSKHLINQNKKIPTFLLLRHFNEDDKKEHYTFHSNDEDSSVSKLAEINFPLKSRVSSTFLRIVGSCNGLICFCDDQFGTFPTKPIILFNPSIQKHLFLPLPTVHPRSRDYVLGFGFDSQKSDFKVLRIVYDKTKSQSQIQSQSPSVDLSAKAEIYSLNKKNWGKIKLTELDSKPICSWRNVYYNGVVHWLAYNKKNSRNFILGFDFRDENFRETLLPEALATAHAASFDVNVHCDDGLAIVEYNGFTRSCNVWVMKEYGVMGSWKKLYNIDLVEGMDEVIGFRNNNGEVFVKMLANDPLPYHLKRGFVVSYDPKSRLIKDLGVLGWLNSLYIHNYIDTLALLA
ncbi:hypothetical protein M9H77_20092 [Catharanthus roseus]|uniref:Uncharacterized protein n=1 Tax=Catharanthus roseus TaxID=4058 RepID=A0ACC0AJJ9_CATRO|nr:hypothetical protein M9H77_20092 [Catharanthus roseus]